TGTDAIRQCALNARTAGIFLRKGDCGLPLPGGLERFVLFTGSDRNRATGITLCVRTLWPIETRTTIRTGKLDLDDLIIAIISRRGPARTGMACRIDGVLLVSVDHKSTHIEATLDLGLPADVLARWPPELYSVVTLARRQQLRIEIPSIDNM